MPTIRDVASLAGVSIATVSRVINGHVVVALETRERVRQGVERIGYTPNEAAKELRMRRVNANGASKAPRY